MHAIAWFDDVAACWCDDPASLYAHWYAPPREGFTVPAGCPPDLVELLRSAHTGWDRWEDGWRVENVGPRGQAVVRRGGERRLLERIDYSPVSRPGLLPRVGDAVAVCGRRDRVDPDGWWRTGGSAWAWTETPPGIVRLYFDLGLPALPGIVGGLTALLRDEREPWLLKCATSPAVHARPDAVVAYMTMPALDRHAAEIVGLAGGDDAMGGLAAPGRGPALTFPVVPGLSAAFDPGGDESFGGHRCRLIAGAAGRDGVAEALVAGGVDPDRPWALAGDPLLPWER